MAKQNKRNISKLAKGLARKSKHVPLGRSRRRADRMAANILAGGDRFIADAHVLRCLESWKFHRNNTRKNVFPTATTEYVYSDTLGLVATRDSKRIVLSNAVVKYPDFFRLLCGYLNCHQPVGKFGYQWFPFTSVNIN